MSKTIEPELVYEEHPNKEELEGFSMFSSFSDLKGKYIKKYVFSMAVVCLGLFVGGTITAGIFAGLFSAAGFGLTIERLKEVYPEGYNWVLDHPGLMEVLTTVLFTGVFGLTVTGIVCSLVSNILTSVILDYYSEKEGRIEGVEKLTLGKLIRMIIDGFKNFFGRIKQELFPGKGKVVKAPVVVATEPVIEVLPALPEPIVDAELSVA